MALLTRTSEDVVQTFEVFEVRLDEKDVQALADNPRAYLARLLEGEGITVNGVYFDPEVINGDGGVEINAKMYHCKTPPNISKSMVISPR
jgi:hypothetical protein